MKSYLLLLLLVGGALISVVVGLTAGLPTESDAPELTISQFGTVISADWTAVAGAAGYWLYYAPYPELHPVRRLDMGAQFSLSGVFGELDSYAIAVRAYGGDGVGVGEISSIAVAELEPARSGGETTVFTQTSNSFSTPAPNLSEAGLFRHLDGDTDFGNIFVTAPAPVNPGLGPVYNHSSCEGCHPKDGRDAAPADGEQMDTMFLRLSLPGVDPSTGGPVPVPGFGTQLFTKAVFGSVAEAGVTVRYREETVVLRNGTVVSLRTPSYDIDPYIDLPQDVLLSPRIGPPVFGRGLLEAIPEETILAMADEDDLDGDGISGRPNFVWDPEEGRTRLGRFGLKANAPSLRIQTAAAFHGDIGVTSPVFTQESSTGQLQDDGKGDDPEIGEEILGDTTFYIQTLAVPARRNVDSREVQRGQLVFAQAGCTGCHVPVLKTGDTSVEGLANQAIRPYTDMLLHDMGEGLADGRPDFLATGREWRTPPLWGIGLTKVVNGHTSFLHDGRARNLLEAIIWHGGEAEKSRRHVENLSKTDLDALLAFLNSL